MSTVSSRSLLHSISALQKSTKPFYADWLFLGFVAAYTVDVAVRLVGLGFKYFFANLWNTYDLVVIIGVNISTFPILADVNSSAFIQLQKVFLVGLVFKLVQRNDSLNQLFKTAT